MTINPITFRTEYTIEILPQQVQKLIDTPSGPIGRFTQMKAQQIEQLAGTKVGTEYSGTTGRPKESRQKRLKDSGEVISAGGANWRVVFRHPIAFIHHQGAKRHVIGAKNQGLYNSNSPVRGPSKRPRSPFSARGPVDHPGHDGNPFLLDATREVGLQASGGLQRGSTSQGPTVFPIFRTTSLG